MPRLTLAVAVLLSAFVERAAVAQIAPPMESADTLAQQIFQRTAGTGMVIAVVRNNEVWVNGYGRTAPGSRDVPQGNSLLRLCSISKILATDLLAKLVAEKKISFDDPLQKFAPPGVMVPTRTVRGPVLRPVNLGDLATHTAGLPREIAYPPAGYAHFTFPDFAYRWQWLPGFRLRTSPGDAAHYSNIGFDLLADAESKATGEPYAKLFYERTAEPLGLADTTLTPSPAQCERLISGTRDTSQCTDTQAAAGSGGMYSTADDMARFMKYLLYLPGVPVHQSGLSTGMYLDPAKLHSIQGLGHAGVPTGIGLGWLEINATFGESRIVEKTGGGAGFQTYIALNPARHAGIFIARTDSRSRPAGNMFREANDMLLAMVGLPPVPADLNDPERERTAEELAEAAPKARSRTARPGSRGAVTSKRSRAKPAVAAGTRVTKHPATVKQPPARRATRR